MWHVHPHFPEGETKPLNIDEIKSTVYEIVDNNSSRAVSDVCKVFDLVQDEENNVELVTLPD